MAYFLSPDGNEIAFIDPADGSLKAVSLGGGEPRLIFRGPAQGGAWTTRTADISSSSRTANARRVPARGGEPLPLDLGIPKMQWFALHPDNRRFAFSIDEGSKNELWVMENFLPAAKADK